MARAEFHAIIDLIGKPQFRRLVEFLADVEDYAHLTADDDLHALVEQARSDLAEMH